MKRILIRATFKFEEGFKSFNHPKNMSSLENNNIKPNICIVGAGFSGICAGIKLKSELGIDTFTIYDGNQEFGGTWAVNSYPGCRCDIQSHLYSLSFELNPNWSVNYAKRNEILDYIKKVCAKHKLYANAEFGTLVQALEWEEDRSQWLVTTLHQKSQSISQTYFDIVISGVGLLSRPNIHTKFLDFKGILMHSAQWRDDVDLRGKRVGVIGCGASAIQVIPAVAKMGVNELHCYQRHPAYLIPKLRFSFPDFIQKLFKIFPWLMLILRLIHFLFNELLYTFLSPGTTRHKLAQRFCLWFMKKQLDGDRKLRRALRPDYKLGVKQLLVASNYFPTFKRGNVTIHRGDAKIEGNSVIDDEGKTQELDILILATGFKVQDTFEHIRFIGRNKFDLYKEWKANGPSSWKGVMSNKFPNAFFLFGYNTVVGHSSVLFMIECQTSFMIKVLRESMKRRAKLVNVKAWVEQDWMSQLERDMSKTLWGQEKFNSYYTAPDGRVTALYPKSCISYNWETAWVNFNDIEFK